MRVLVVSNLYPPNVVGGYERLCFEVASELVRRGHEVAVLTSNYGGEVRDYPGQAVGRDLKLFTGRTIYEPFAGTDAERAAITGRNLAHLAAAVERHRPEVVFSWNLFFLDPSLLAALEKLPVPVVAMLTDNWLINMVAPGYMAGFFARHVFGAEPFDPASEPVEAKPGARSWLRRLLGMGEPGPEVPAPARDMTAIFGSAFMRHLHRGAGLRFRSEEVVHNGVDQSHGGRVPTLARDRLVEEGRVRLLFAGRLVDLKGAHTLVEAMTLLAPRRPSLLLTIIGDLQDRAYQETLERLVAESGCAESIVFAPPVPEDKLFDLFQQHDIYVFPSLYEPFSLTLIHALACAIPTVASDAGGNVEIVFDRQSGLLFRKGDARSLADAISALIDDPALRRRVAEGGREIAAPFSFGTMVGRMESVLQASRR